MKKIIILSLFFLFALDFAGAQDIIYKKDGSKEEVKVVMVGDREIQYKKFSNPDGPVYSVSRDEILLITYQNGEYETISQPENPQPQETASIDLKTDFARNLFAYHLFDVVYGDFTISYERILSSGTVSLVIPVGFGYAYNSDYHNSSDDAVKNLIYSGVGVNFYPTGQGKWRYFLGPNIRVGYGKQSFWTDIYGNYGEYMGQMEEVSEGVYSKFFVDNGVIFTPVRSFSVSAVLGVGVRYFPQAAYDYSTVLPTAYFAINMHYRF